MLPPVGAQRYLYSVAPRGIRSSVQGGSRGLEGLAPDLWEISQTEQSHL